MVDEEKVHILVGTKLGYSKGGEGGQRQHNSSYTAMFQTYTIVVGGGAQGWTSSTNHSGANSSGFGVTANGGRGSYVTGGRN